MKKLVVKGNSFVNEKQAEVRTVTTELTVNRKDVFDLANYFLDFHKTVPKLTEFRKSFSTPTSPAIAVYFSEWKTENADKLAEIADSKAFWKARAEGLETQLLEMHGQVQELASELSELKDWLVGEHLDVLLAWETLESVRGKK